MSILPDVRVGEPIRHESLSVFPLFAPPAQPIDYVLSDEAIREGQVVVEEQGEEGSVPTLVVTNTSGSRVLFLEGEELRGAKQNRVLNTSVLVAAGGRTPIPVSCVEQGRWRYRTRQFVSGGSHSSPQLRRRLKESVSYALKAGRGHRSDQMAVWEEVDRQSRALGSSSDTGAMADTYGNYQHRLDEFRARLSYPEGATGVAVAVGQRVVAVDLFDRPETCRKVWDRLLTGVVMDALEAGEAPEAASPADVEAMLGRLRDNAWEPAPAVGEGQEFRSDTDTTHGSALVCDGTLLHGSVVVAG